MAVDESFLNYVKDQLSEIGEFQAKKMFGGVGFFKEGIMFGMLGGAVFRLRVDDTNKPDFEAKGMKPYSSKTKKKGMPYYEVPVEVLEDKDILKTWALKAFEVAKKHKK
ncbi:TfoX/Sxy family protein [Algibacter sp. 2305UL17-15]|uniref:TfoX/Sxy family protein n=1 Tax=Algibacter sp. 2305UL17-15 TaxID=3231268 RepID=UPI003459E2FE